MWRSSEAGHIELSPCTDNRTVCRRAAALHRAQRASPRHLARNPALRALQLPPVLLAAASLTSTVSNREARRDQNGAIIDAHDGNVVYDPASARWLYFAAGYGDYEEPPGLNGCASWCDDCGCGFFYNHSFNVYSTADFVSWTGHGNVLPLGRPNRTLFSPKALYNNRTSTWVLWLNFVPPYNSPSRRARRLSGPFRSCRRPWRSARSTARFTTIPTSVTSRSSRTMTARPTSSTPPTPTCSSSS